MSTITSEQALLAIELATRMAKVKNSEKAYNEASEGGYKNSCFGSLQHARANLEGFKQALELQGALKPVQDKADELMRMVTR